MREKIMDGRHNLGSFADSPADPLDRSTPDIANRKHARD